MAYSVTPTHQLDKPILQGLQVSSAAALHPLGDTVRGSDGKEYTYVYWQSSEVLMYSGRPMVAVDTTGDYVFTCDCSDSAGGKAAGGSGPCFGVATMNNVSCDAAYVWMQTKGLVDSALVSAVVALNDLLIAEAEDCFDDLTPYHTSATSTNWHACAVALTAAAAGVTSLHSTASIMLL